MAIVLSGQTPNNDVFRIDAADWHSTPQYVSLIGLWDGMPATLLAACRARRAATLTNICPLCPYTDRLHNTTCPASYRPLQDALSKWENRTARAHRGRRLVENPADTVGTIVYDLAAGPEQRQLGALMQEHPGGPIQGEPAQFAPFANFL